MMSTYVLHINIEDIEKRGIRINITNSFFFEKFFLTLGICLAIMIKHVRNPQG